MRMNRNRSWNRMNGSMDRRLDWNRMNGSMDRRLDWNMDSNNIYDREWPERCVQSRS